MRIRSLLTAALSVTLITGGMFPASAMAVDHTAPSALTTRAAVSAETTPDAEAEPVPEPSLVIAPTQPVLENETTTLQIDAHLTNPTVTKLPAGELVVELSSAPAKSAAELADLLSVDDPQASADAATDSTAAFTQVGSSRLGSTAAVGEQRASVYLAPDELPFTAATAPGTYVVRASLIPEEATAALLVSTTPVVWRGTGSRGLALSVIVPFVLPANIHTMPTRNQLSELAPKWDELLTAAETADATLAIDPRILASIRGYGTQAPTPAREFLSRLQASANASFLLQFADADPAAQAAIGFTSLLSPTNFDFVTRLGEFEAPTPADNAAGADTAAADAGSPASDAPRLADAAADESTSAEPADNNTTATDTDTDTEPASEAEPAAEAKAETESETTPEAEPSEADPSEAAPPTLAELTAWAGRGATAATAWPAENNVDQGTLDFLERSRISSVVLDSRNVTHTGGPRITLPGGTAVVTDAGIGADAALALTGETDTERAAGLAQLAGTMFVRAQAGDAKTNIGMVLGLDRASIADGQDPAQLLNTIEQFDFVRSVPVADQAEGTGTLRAAGPLEPRLALLRSSADREAAVNEVGAVLVRPQYLSGYQRTRLLDLFATRYASAESDFEADATKYRKRDAKLLEGVQAISTEHTQLVGVSTSVPVQLHNSLPFTANVTVGVMPVSAALEVQERVFTDVLVAPEGNERVLVPVRSRVSSGESGLVVTVSAAGGTPTVYTGTLPLSISSSVETVALWIMGASAAFLLAFGVYRSVRKRRNAAHEGALESAVEEAEELTEPDIEQASGSAVGSAEGETQHAQE